MLQFKGIPEFDKLQNLVDVLTNFIYICSVEHSATSFPAYDQYAFPPNFAAMLHGHPDDAVVVHFLLNFYQNTIKHI